MLTNRLGEDRWVGSCELPLPDIVRHLYHGSAPPLLVGGETTRLKRIIQNLIYLS